MRRGGGEFEREADLLGAQLLARAGQDLTKYGLRYSHLGIAYRSRDGVMRVLHAPLRVALFQLAAAQPEFVRVFASALWISKNRRADQCMAAPPQSRSERVVRARRRKTSFAG